MNYIQGVRFIFNTFSRVVPFNKRKIVIGGNGYKHNQIIIDRNVLCKESHYNPPPLAIVLNSLFCQKKEMHMKKKKITDFQCVFYSLRLKAILACICEPCDNICYTQFHFNRIMGKCKRG